MTTLRHHDVRCGACGADSQQTLISSTNAFGSPDLDLRPPEMQRSTMRYWMQECPSCGYVARSIDVAPSAAARTTVQSADYRALIDDRHERALYSRFSRASLLAEADDKTALASRMALYAAWGADDAGLAEEARSHRRLAARGYAMMIAAKRDEDEPLDDEAVATLRAARVDMLRRAGDFEEAIVEAERLIAEAPEEIFATIARFQVDMARRRNIGCYTVENATGAV